MRTARMKRRGQPCYYHLFNRIAGMPGEYPFTDEDKEWAYREMANLGDYYLIETVSLVWLGNHFHGIFYAPAELPEPEAICARHNAFWGKRRPTLLVENTEQVEKIGREMIDISHLMQQYQQRFTRRLNKKTGRRGTLWGSRFKSTILDGRESLWSCVKYVELNAVRAGLVTDAADYRHCTWGRYCGGGAHALTANFVQHMKRSRGERGLAMTDEELFGEFRGELARALANDRQATTEEIEQAVDKATESPTFELQFTRRTRHWTQGAILGTRHFVEEVAAEFVPAVSVARKQLGRAVARAGSPLLYCWRRLRT